jgi:hypothetical protein
MHLEPESGAIEFVNSHCPILPFWIEPGKAFERRWDDMNLMLNKLAAGGFPYSLSNPKPAEQGGGGNPLKRVPHL